MTRLNCGLLVGHARSHVDPMRNAVAVGHDQRRAVIALGFNERLDRLPVVGPRGDLGDVNIPIAHRHHADVFFLRLLSGRGELG